jgi:hypothetical protein
MDGGPAFALEGSGNFLLLGANRAYRQSPDETADYFFVESLSIQSPVPAPASIVLFASGLIMLAGLRISRLS